MTRSINQMRAAVIAVVVILTAPSARTVEAAACGQSAGPIAITSFALTSNPLCSGQNLFYFSTSTNCSSQTQTYTRFLQLLDGAGNVLQNFPPMGPFTLPPGNLELENFIAPTTGAPAFSGQVRVTNILAGGQQSDQVVLPLVIVASCPTLPPPIPPYGFGP